MPRRVVGAAIALSSDGSIYVAGGQEAEPADLSLTFANLWLAKFSSDGEQLWEVTLPLDDAESTARSAALVQDGQGPETLVVLQTTFDGENTPTLLRFTTDGALIDEFELPAGLERVRPAGDGTLLAVGSELLEMRAGRPFTELWVGGVVGDTVSWQETVVGSDGSISVAYDAVAADDARYYVAGSRGSAANSNASDVFIAAGTPGGGLQWSEVPVPGVANGRAVSLDPIGSDVLVTGNGEYSFVSRYDEAGTNVWSRPLDRYPTVVRAAPQGYLVGYHGHASATPPLDSLRIDYFNSDGEVLWRKDDSDCNEVTDLALDGSVLYALESCSFTFRLERYDLR